MAAVVLDDFDQDLDIQFVPDEMPVNANVAETSHRYKPKPNRGQGRNAYPNPYKMNPFEVRKADFREARLYDEDLAEPGWTVQAYFANRKWRRWLYLTRKEPGMKGFRRSFIPRDDELEPESASQPAPKEGYVPQSVPIFSRPANLPRNRNTRLMPQSRVKGARPGDDDFKAKMFTQAMGKEIASLRQQIIMPNEKPMTQADLAKKLNVDAAMIRNIEKGGLITFNSEDVLVKEMAKVLGVASIKYQE